MVAAIDFVIYLTQCFGYIDFPEIVQKVKLNLFSS